MASDYHDAIILYMTRIAIIGAGASGLAALKYALEVFGREDVQDQLEVCVFEKQSEVGGVWHDDHRRKTSHSTSGCHERVAVTGDDVSPMYDGLRTNLPHDLMSYRDHLFPSSTPTFPTADQVQEYLVSYADRFALRDHIRFDTTVTRLCRLKGRWTIETQHAHRGAETSEWDNIVVANGHYADTHIPTISGLSSFAGKITHSRYYRSPEEYAGQTIMVVGSFASGSDLARQLASLNLADDQPSTKVYVSSSGDTSYARRDGEWAKYVIDVPIIRRVDGKRIELEDGQVVDDVDVVIFATGYYYSLPFCKAADAPWDQVPVLDEALDVDLDNGPTRHEEKIVTNGHTEANGSAAPNGHAGVNGHAKPSANGHSKRDDAGIRGFHMDNLDPLLLFLRTDRTIAFPTLQYQVVPFPLAEAQTRLLALLWAGLLPSFPTPGALRPPSNPSNPFTNPDSDGAETVRKVVSMRREFVFGHPYEWTYEEYLMELCLEADGDKTAKCWRAIEDWRRARRSDTGLRKKTLGY